MPECVTPSCRRQASDHKKCKSCLEASRRWRARNPKKQRSYRQANRNRHNAYQAVWIRDHPGIRRAKKLRRRAREVDAACDETLMKDYLPIIALDPCAYCGASGGEVDHVTALVEGGTNRWDNLTAACRSCNGSKCDKPLLEYLLCR